MKNEAGTPMTLEERLERAAKSQASSPEAAVRLVQRFARLHSACLFHGNADLDLMYGLIGPYMNQMEDDILHYSGFCHSVNLAVFAEDAPQAGTEIPFRPSLGIRAGNAVVLMGLMLLDHAKGRGQDEEIYHCTRMTLGQYLDALEAAALPEAGETVQKFRHWRELFLKRCPPATPLADVLASLLRQYIHGWKMFDCLNHVLGCMEELSSYLTEDVDRELRETMRRYIAEAGVENVEVVPDEQREEYPDPAGHFMDLALAYSWDVPDPAGEGLSAGAVRGEIFLSGRDFSPASLRAAAVEAPTPEFRTLLEQLISEQRLYGAMSELDEAVSNLFMLWVGPYLWMDGPAASEK